MKTTPTISKNPLFLTALIAVVIGLIAFGIGLFGPHPERAWQAYLINFLLWSAIAQGGLLFATLMHTTKARWSGPLQGLAESFSAFFPISAILFIFLFLGSKYIFVWHQYDLHGKEIWLNIPFLFSRNLLGLLVLYGVGGAYLYYAMRLRLTAMEHPGKIRAFLQKRWDQGTQDPDKLRSRMNLFSILYMLAFGVILSLIGYDLVMSLDPHWFSTLFGAYTFIKAFYVGLGALIILASILHLNPAIAFSLKPAQFHDLGKLFFAFCLLWADFFYAQFVVIWYGNISEETAYVIKRTMSTPWSGLAWFVFIICFILPFFILINKKIKTRPKFMSILCAVVIMGIWLEHFLLISPALFHDVKAIPVGLMDGLIFVGFFGLMVLALTAFFSLFPEITRGEARGVN